VSDARTVAHLLALDVLLRVQENNADGALASCTAILNAGRATGDTPGLVAVPMHIGIVHLALNQIERTLAQGEPSDAALADLQRLLEDEDRQPVLLYGLRGERGNGNRICEGIRSGKVEARLFGFRSQWDLEMILESFLSGSLKSQQANLLRHETRFVEAAKLPPEQQDARLTQIGPAPQTQLLSRMLSPGMAMVIREHRLVQAQARSVLTALAVERYRRKEGQWPASLTALVPEYLAQVPLDPYDGQPLRYSRLTNGVVIYSLGPDRTDNGGKLDRTYQGLTGTDRGIQLWDVSRRRQLYRAAPGKPAAQSAGQGP
jgi:hypothetical protein